MYHANVWFFSLMVRAGTDVAGEVVEVGSGVKNFKAGDKVVAMLSRFVSFILPHVLFFFLVTASIHH